MSKREFAAGSKSRVQNTTSDTTVKATAGVLHTIVVTNAHASAIATLTLRDGATVLGVFEIPFDDTRTLEFGVKMATSIKVQPSIVELDALVIYD